MDEIYRQSDPHLWNQSVNELIRLLCRMQARDALPEHEAMRLVIRLEAHRTRANEDFAELMTLREQMNALRKARNSAPQKVEEAISFDSTQLRASAATECSAWKIS